MSTSKFLDARTRAKRIELITRKWVDEVLTGQYRSHFRGQGMQFAEHRVYQAGDDVRHIDWKASARTREPLIKKFDEERELNVLLVMDASASLGFGSQGDLKSDVVALIAGLISYAALRTGDRVGAMFFTDTIEHSLRPMKGRNHSLRLIQEVLAFRPKSRGTDLGLAVESARRTMKHSGIIFLVSDFQAALPERELTMLARRNDVVGVCVSDPGETLVDPGGWVRARDPETGQERWVNGRSYDFVTAQKNLASARAKNLTQVFKKSGAELMQLSSAGPYAEDFVRFLEKRRRQRKRRA